MGEKKNDMYGCGVHPFHGHSFDVDGVKIGALWASLPRNTSFFYNKRSLRDPGHLFCYSNTQKG